MGMSGMGRCSSTPSSNMESIQDKNGRAPPTQDCDGYPPALMPRPLQSCAETSFYLCGDDGPDLACSVTQYLGPPDSRAGDLGHSFESLKQSLDRSRPVIIVCHGLLSWRNQMLISHLASGLADEAKCHTIRFDFRGNGHSSGEWGYGNYAGELSDLQRVVSFLRNDLGCRVACIVGHSKGSAAALQHAWGQDEHDGSNDEIAADEVVPCYVNIAGRFVVRDDFDPASRFSKEQCSELSSTGKFQLTSIGGRGFEITQHDIKERRNLDMSLVSTINSASVLTIHGDADTSVRVESARKFDASIPKHELKIIHGADHNFNGLKHMRVLVSTIGDFLRRHRAC